MAGLLYKDFIVQRKNIIMIAISVILITSLNFLAISGEDTDFEFFNLFSPLIYVFTFSLVGMMQEGLFEGDERKKWAYYASASPLSVYGQVGSKYFFSLIISIAVLMYSMLSNFIVIAIAGEGSSPMILFAFLFYLQIFNRALEFPFIIRFGSKSGTKIKSYLFLIVVSIVGIYFLFGDLSIFGSMEEFVEKIMNIMLNQNYPAWTMIAFGVFSFVSIAAYYISYRISCKLYLRGVEDYAK